MTSGCGFLIFLSIFASLSHSVLAGFGNVGGPLAKAPRKTPSSKTRTTLFPHMGPAGIDDPDFKDQNAKINLNIIKQANWSVPAIQDKPQFSPPAPGDYGDMCCWVPHKNQVLNDFANGQANPPFYGFISEESCPDEATCLQKCTKEKCNLAIWNSDSHSAKLFVAHKDKLNNLRGANFTKQSGNDTLVRRCLRQYDITPTCKELVASNCPLCDEFIAFVTKYNRTYKGCEFVRRFEIFKLNKLKIAQLNDQRKLDDDATFTVTRFTDWLHDEFLKFFTGAFPDRGTNVVGENIVKDECVNSTGTQDLSLRFDWTEKEVIPPVRDQQECGSCYAFASTDQVAAQFQIDRSQFGKSFTLAPQYILDCFKEPAALGCDGGRAVKVIETLSKCGGKNSAGCEFPLETCLPYKNEASNLCDKPSCPAAPKIKVEKYGMVDMSNDYLEKQKMAGLVRRGPLTVLIDASDAWQFYEGGIIRAYQCTTKTNHAVLMTGYDFGVAVPAYIIQNTWSDDWGEAGYVYLEAGVNACGVCQAVTYACTDNCSGFCASHPPGSTPLPGGSPAPQQPSGTTVPQQPQPFTAFPPQPQPAYPTPAVTQQPQPNTTPPPQSTQPPPSSTPPPQPTQPAYPTPAPVSQPPPSSTPPPQPQPYNPGQTASTVPPQPNYAAAPPVTFPQTQPPTPTQPPQEASTPQSQPTDQPELPTATEAPGSVESTERPEETPAESPEADKRRDDPSNQTGRSRSLKIKLFRVKEVQ